MAQQAAFWDRVAPRYAARPIDDPDAYAATLERARAHLGPDERALELGAGTGATAVALAPCVAEYRATDLSPKMVEIGRARPEAAGLAHLTFDVAPAREALAGGPWDAVLAFNLLHLLDDLPGALGQIRDALVPGGRLISKTPCLADLGLWLRVVVPAMQLVGKAPPVRFVSAKGLEREILRAGLEIVETGDYPAARAQRLVIARRPG